MKLAGYECVREYGTSVLPQRDGDPINLKIQSVGSEFERLHAKPCWYIEPPTVFRRNAKGEIERDKDGRPVEVVNREDPKYRARENEINALIQVALIYLGLVTKDQGGDAEWDTDPATMADKPLEFFRAIRDEMEAVGLSRGARDKLWFDIMKLGTPTKEDVEAAEGQFPAS